ncbi:MAG: DNA mismatch repair endonuclease MutL [Chloroflexi bacterium]|nr:DNA mismatch repair endonuclease MutL [Chloroflexota bacterium]
MPIRILPQDLASQIAAGEVVERPASVVKELIENALDAGASQINVRIEGAGQQLIEVTDDGEGIPAEELPMAVARHATSKLVAVEDLQHISTLGFRGEALAAIGSVSRLTITTRIADSSVGSQLRVDGGNLREMSAVGAAVGTQILVEDLFFNVPARRKFLKHDNTERRRILVLVTRYAFAYPQVRFALDMEGRPRLQTAGNGDRREVLASLYGLDIARRMIAVDVDYGDIKVTGFISPTDLTRSNRAELNFFVNGRWVQDAALSSAVVQAYHGLLMVGRFPQVALFINMPPDRVDVNVHPTKAEVRFLERDQVFSAVQRAVRRAMLAHTPVPKLDPAMNWQPLESLNLSTDTGEDSQVELALVDRVESSQDDEPQQAPLPRSNVRLLRLVGQVGSAYLVAEAPDGLYLVDQHAAHERVLFERFMAQRGHLVSQRLLEPVTVELSPGQASLLEEQLPRLKELAFDVEPFGPNTFVLRAIPEILLGSDPELALRVLVEDFEEDERPLETEREAQIIARVCKRAAVKAGQKLSLEEQGALLRDLEACDAPRTCPHGRPTMVHLSIDLLEKQFGRRGAR